MLQEAMAQFESISAPIRRSTACYTQQATRVSSEAYRFRKKLSAVHCGEVEGSHTILTIIFTQG
jgi:hypothetical protein